MDKCSYCDNEATVMANGRRSDSCDSCARLYATDTETFLAIMARFRLAELQIAQMFAR